MSQPPELSLGSLSWPRAAFAQQKGLERHRKMQLFHKDAPPPGVFSVPLLMHVPVLLPLPGLRV